MITDHSHTLPVPSGLAYIKESAKYLFVANGRVRVFYRIQEANLSPGLVSASSNQGKFGSGREPGWRAWFSSLERRGSPMPPRARFHQVEPTTDPVDAFNATTLAPTASSTEARRARATASKSAADHNSVDTPGWFLITWWKQRFYAYQCWLRVQTTIRTKFRTPRLSRYSNYEPTRVWGWGELREFSEANLIYLGSLKRFCSMQISLDDFTPRTC